MVADGLGRRKGERLEGGGGIGMVGVVLRHCVSYCVWCWCRRRAVVGVAIAASGESAAGGCDCDVVYCCVVWLWSEETGRQTAEMVTLSSINSYTGQLSLRHSVWREKSDWHCSPNTSAR